MIRAVTVLMIAALLLTGCGASAPEGRANSIEGAVESMLTQAPDQPVSRPVTGTITGEEAERIALEHAGFTADQVTRLRTEFETDDGVPRYEVRFRQDRWEYDYEIDANTGAILSYDRDD